MPDNRQSQQSVASSAQSRSRGQSTGGGVVGSVVDRFRTARYDRALDGDGPVADDGGQAVPSADLLSTERSLRERLWPSTLFGKLFLLAAFIGGVFLISYFEPTIPPQLRVAWVQALLLGALAVALTWLRTRKAMLRYWSKFDTVQFFQGGQVVTKVGKVEGAAGDDPLFKELKTVGFAGLNPRYRTVDEVFQRDEPLTKKIHRRKDPERNTWQAAKTRLSHIYLGEGEDDLRGRHFVVHCRGTERVPHAESHDVKTLPPNSPDDEAVRRLKSKHRQQREELIPMLEEQLEARGDRLDELRQEEGSKPRVTIDEAMELLAQMGYVIRPRSGGRPKSVDSENVGPEFMQNGDGDSPPGADVLQNGGGE